MKLKKIISRLWVEKHRPLILDDIIFQDDKQKKYFKNRIKEGDIPNFLFSGVQGSGKTTLSQAIVHELEIDRSDILVVNSSDETGIDAMRDKIGRFSETMPLGNMKIVRLEEMDSLSQPAQAILRKIIEDSSDTCRFICTCNYANKIIPALKSRLQEFVFKAPDQDLVLMKMAEMLEIENVELENLDILEKYVALAYPDIRKIINLLQQNIVDGKLVWQESEINNADYHFKLLDLIEVSNFTAARKLVCENVSREEYDNLYKWFYQNIHRCPKFKKQDAEESAIVVIADYAYKSSLVAHQDINIAAMFITLGNL
jgi:replication factor C small subunit